jgi:hypothetical protein
MEMKHTPGPWEIDWYICREGDEELWRVPRSIGPAMVDHNHWARDHINVDKADAYLIAAAPELLEALKGVLRVADRATDEFDAARAAVAKATGGQS